MWSNSSLVLLLALLATGYLETTGTSMHDIATTLSESLADNIKENTPKVEQTGGIRQQVLHKGAQLATMTAVNKGTAALVLSAAKYPALAMAAPVAIPVVKVVAAGMLLNAMHQHINNLNKKNGDEELSEEEKKKQEAQEARGNVAANLMDKITGKFTKSSEEEGNSDEKKAETEPKEETKRAVVLDEKLK